MMMHRLATAAILSIACAFPRTSSAQDHIDIPTLAIGAKAPDFDLPGVDGKRYSLQSFADAKLLAIVFTCNHCPTAQAYEGRLKKLVDDYKAKGVALVAISPNEADAVRLDELGYTDLDDSMVAMKIRAKDAGFNFPYLYEGDKTGSARAYGPTATPHLFIFDQERKLRYRGRIDDSEREEYVKIHDARDAIEALLAGKEIANPATKAFGCSIKWKDKISSVGEFMAKLAKEPVTVEKASAEALRDLAANKSENYRLVNFWATWCGPCVTEFPSLIEINRMYRGRNFEFISVAANFPDEEKDVIAFLKKQQASNRNLMFGDTDKYKLLESFDPKWDGSLPYTVLIAPGGEVLYKVNGPINALELKRAIVKALGQRMEKPKAPPASQPKAQAKAKAETK